MALHSVLPKEASRITGKPERPYISSLKPSPMETRRRPLRTYSKRTSTESTEPVPKRRCLASPSTSSRSIRNKESSPVPEEPIDSATVSISEPSLPPIKQGTITAYFGKIGPQPSTTLSSGPSSDPLPEYNEPTITPPSSPLLLITRKRKARRLKTRVVTQPRDEEESSDETQEKQDSEKEIGRTRDTEPTTHTHSPALSGTTPTALDQSEIRSMTRPGAGKPREIKRQKNKVASVQTTLSLSMNEAHYTECMECGMLYNHLHETDVKYHARRHAALRRAKARTDAHSNVTE
ncbi:hypothetical protein F5Y09DRAFT_100074 [Xylaria sp. FL1042]|nr:hypothetical protein F5Y09DRAFT_100074 [Xylaria sp. FL1042]